jgi:ATP-dependent helicase/nuclease subunit A
VKRDLEAEGSAVRVMTVHGVKGLEAPVIVLADTTTLPPKQKEPRLVVLENGGNTSLIWAGPQGEASQPLLNGRNAARALREQEYRRLLYVALTRAADALVICGALNKNHKGGQAEPGSWYDLVYSALASDTAQITRHNVPYCTDEVLRWRTSPLPPPAMRPAKDTPLSEAPPAWISYVWNEAASNEVIRLRPSYSADEPLHYSARGREGGKARGILLHRLLQSLPEVPPEQREASAHRYLAQAAPRLTDALRSDLAREAINVIEHPDCAALFAPGSRAEPELVAQIADGSRIIEIPARLDRLIVTDDKIVFADFKSDAFVPQSATGVPERYIAQLAAYRAALALAFPGRTLRALLVFTAAPRVIEISQEALESAWQRLKTQASPAFS